MTAHSTQQIHRVHFIIELPPIGFFSLVYHSFDPIASTIYKGISKNSLASILRDLFPSYFTKMLGNAQSISCAFSSSDEKISAQSEYIEFLETALEKGLCENEKCLLDEIMIL